MEQKDSEQGTESLSLKWGTLKGWDLKRDESIAILNRYAELGMSFGAMQQNDTPEQKQIICELIDAIDGPIDNDWSGEAMTKAEAKEYVLNYGKGS